MRRRLIGNALLTLLVAGLTVTAAHGQSRRASINRASSRAASTRVGWTGGVFTRQLGGIRPLGGATNANLPQPNYFGAAQGLTKLAPAPVPQAFTFGQTGYAAIPARGSLNRWQGAYSRASLSNASGLAAATRLDAPLTAREPYHMRVPDQPYYAPEPVGTAFHRFFGLTPTEAEAPSETAPFDSLVSILERENEQFLQDVTARGLEEFKRAMTWDTENRDEALAKACRLLTSARDLDSESYVPSLLLVHVALGKSQMLLALRHLTDAVRRHPTLFVEELDVASYFGDRESLEAQMRVYRRIGDERAEQADGYALQAYCAWVLDDQPSLKRALERMMAANRGTKASAGIEAVRYALTAAVK